MRVFLVLLLALTAGGALAYGTYNFVQRPIIQSGPSIPTQPVVVAATDLPLGTELASDDLRVIEWPASAVPQQVFGDPNDVIGRGLIAPVFENEPILPVKLASIEEGAGLPPIIPPGLRAVSVRVNEVIGVAGYVVPGTRVDVVATVSPSPNQQDTTAKVILTNVQVLAAGTKIESDEGNKPMAVNVVTLLVNPEESERLTLAANEGKIQLALRNPLDRESPATTGAKAALLLGTQAPVRRPAPRPAPAAAPAPAPPPPPSPVVEIIRGDKRVQEVVQ
jgi:pilus assembly protein CpaB